MSKAYYFVKNFNFRQIMDLLLYSTQKPQLLTHHQKVTRLYRATLRKYYAQKLEGWRTDFSDFNRSITLAQRDFSKMLELPQTSLEFQNLLKKYEAYHEETFDPSMVIDDTRPYSPSAGRYLVWGDENLLVDPFGYYSGDRRLSETAPSPQMPYYEDYPQNDSHWDIWEIFGKDVPTENVERKHIEELNRHGQ
eukprot:TRINITY_DN3485_c0_g1_i1.p1 TRINITY_DN3485_c0_g1~~TRINITY_DN3485_c0_g1_i1.p1  ORF type:complete len:193 (+),score=57.38 TRINITY_DN3485_c0_g1_i1:115-693(+)